MLEEVVERQNMRAAYQQVKRNAGAPGIDGMSVEELGPHLREEWQGIKEALLDERYEPQPVKRVEIPKPGGGVRQLGIPTVVDRLIQQALHQVMSRVFEPGFSESSYGFRPGRSAHDAVLKAREYVACGKRWVVDMDLEKFRRARGWNLTAQMQELRPLLIGRSNYHKHAEVAMTFDRLDEWIRRRFRCAQWRQWKRPRTRGVGVTWTAHPNRTSEGVLGGKTGDRSRRPGGSSSRRTT